MKRGRSAVFLFVLLAAGECRAQPLDGIAARVDQSAVTWSQVLQESEMRLWAGEVRGITDPWLTVDVLVRRRLLVGEAQKMRLEVAPEEETGELEAFASAGGPPSSFWERMAKLGVSESDVRRRCRDVLLARRYLSLRQEMTYVPEAEVRAFYSSQAEVLGSRSLSEAREEVRAFLAQKKYQQELDQWISRQVAEGRVRLVGSSEPPARDGLGR